MGFHFAYLLSTLPGLAVAALINLRLAAMAIVLAMILGILLTLIRSLKIGPINKAIALLISFVRGTPLLIQIFLFFYVLPALGLNLSPMVAGVAALSFNSMVFVSEILRAGLGTIDPGQIEAATALGLNPRNIWLQVILPQVLYRSLPILVNESTIVLKGTALLSVITVVEVLRTAQQMASASYHPFEPLVGAALAFVVLNLLLSATARVLDHRMGAFTRAAR